MESKDEKKPPELEMSQVGGCLKMGCITFLINPLALVLQSYVAWVLYQWFLAPSIPQIPNVGIAPFIGLTLLFKLFSLPFQTPRKTFGEKGLQKIDPDKNPELTPEQQAHQIVSVVEHSLFWNTATSFVAPTFILLIGWMIMWVSNLFF